MKKKMELRMSPTKIEASEDGSMIVSGYANRTETYSEMLGRGKRFKEIIKRGAWKKALERASEIHFLAEHDPKKILASTRNDSLKLHEDENGLYFEARISPTSWGKDYYQLIKDGILRNMSFGFRAKVDEWRNKGDFFEREIFDLDLFEISVVRDPAYAQSSISARGIELVEDEVPKTEENHKLDNGIKIEIRSEEEIEAIAKKLFEYITKNAKVAEQHKDKSLEELEKQTKNEEDEQTDEPDEEQESDKEKEKDEQQDEQKQDDEEEVEDIQPQENKDEDKSKDADKIREFINKIKNGGVQ